MSSLFIGLLRLITVGRRAAQLLLFYESSYFRFAKDNIRRVAVAIVCRCKHILESKLPRENVVDQMDSVRL
jgi:hypothetical protein